MSWFYKFILESLKKILIMDIFQITKKESN